MTTFTLADVEKAFRGAWSIETTSLDEGGRSRWDAARPFVGQCGPTALVVQDLLGGDLLYGQLSGGDRPDENHYWNRFPGGVEIDLTRQQIEPGRIVGEPKVVVRPPEGPRRHAEAYRLLRARVFTALGIDCS
jgi:hypothetical protein